MAAELSLDQLREEIDKIDEVIVRLLDSRARCAYTVGRLKHELGRPIYELSPMSSSMTTGQTTMCYGDWSRYFVVDHVRGAMVDFVPVVIDQATGRPNASRAWLFTWRTGAGMVDVDAGRCLRL